MATKKKIVCKHEKEHRERRDISFGDGSKTFFLHVWCADCGKKLRVVELEG